MKILFDTSVLVAAVLPSHASHAPSICWLNRAKQGAFTFVVAGHTLAEMFAVLTRMPSKPKLPPLAAWSLVEQNILKVAAIECLVGAHYVDLIQELAQQGLGGGIVYDAIIARVAEIAKVDVLLTLNESDFRRVWPGGASRVVSPLTMSPP